eukprot:TRINITY_DN2799_c0_g1_i1.p1 TRINITY_DN2799_c0_g1~~TRINITY_DN2799_c0_g1_i1.p1  ORF type:complete len:427 (+),score=79.57 TRINITY_DN2799_c0_g1_i1:37-1281(+)
MMWQLLLLFGYVVLSALTVYSLLFGQTDFHRNGLIGWYYRFITGDLLRYGDRFLEKVVPAKLRSGVVACANYFVHEKNPVLLIVYVMLVMGGYFAFLFFGAPLVPNSYVGAEHLVIPHVVIAICMGWFYYLLQSDPGVVTAESMELHSSKYHYESFLYGKRFCTECQQDKPPRSKHCYVCGHCVARFDHHCPWLNGDVGASNTWKFLVFLLLTALVCTYCSILSANVVIGEMDGRGMLTEKFKTNGGEERYLPFGFKVQWAMATYTPLMGLSFFTGAMSVVLYGFLLYQMYLVAVNTTTNESFKWKDIMDYAKRQDRRRRYEQKTKQKVPLARIANGAPGSLVRNEFNLEDLSAKDVRNSYHRGVWNNFVEVFNYERWEGTKRGPAFPSTSGGSPPSPTGGAKKRQQKRKKQNM